MGRTACVLVVAVQNECMSVLEQPRTISDAAQATGLSAHTLRYYERAGLMLDRPERASSSHRRYSDADLRWIELLVKLRNTGMPIRRIREYADMVRAGEATEQARLELLESHRREVLARLEQTQRDLAAIDHKIAVYRDRCGNC